MYNNYFLEQKTNILLYYLLKSKEEIYNNPDILKPFLIDGLFQFDEMKSFLEYFITIDIIKGYDIEILSEYPPNIILNHGFDTIDNTFFNKYITPYYNKWFNGNSKNPLLKNKEYQTRKVSEYISKVLPEFSEDKIIIKYSDINEKEIDLFCVLLFLEKKGEIKLKGISVYDDIFFEIKILKTILPKQQNDFILNLEGNEVTLYNNKTYKISGTEYKILNRFFTSTKTRVNIFDTSISPSMPALNKSIQRLQNKLNKELKINKVMNYRLWYLKKKDEV